MATTAKVLSMIVLSAINAGALALTVSGSLLVGFVTFSTVVTILKAIELIAENALHSKAKGLSN